MNIGKVWWIEFGLICWEIVIVKEGDNLDFLVGCRYVYVWLLFVFLIECEKWGENVDFYF